MPYEIGYKRPPKSAQFAKGKSGNPKGRPKGSKNFLTVLEKELGQSISVNENGRKKKMTRLEAMVKRLVGAALQGDQRSLLTLVEVFKRTGGLDQAQAGASLLPDDYESILAAYVQKQSKTQGGKTAERKST